MCVFIVANRGLDSGRLGEGLSGGLVTHHEHTSAAKCSQL